MLWSSLLFSLAAAPVWAQVTADIQNTAAGQSNGAISLNFPEGYPTDQLESIVWYPLDTDHNYILDGSGNATVQPDDDPTTPIEIGGLSAGWYRVVYNRVGWCLLSNEYRTAGNYQINDEGGEYANGLYLFSLEVCNRNKAVIGIKW